MDDGSTIDLEYDASNVKSKTMLPVEDDSMVG